jgi:hypothetical protein
MGGTRAVKLDVTIAMFLNGMNIVLASESAKAGPTRLGLLPSKVVLRGTDSVQQLAVDRLVGDQEPGNVTRAARFESAFVLASTFLDAFGRPKRDVSCECERASDATLSESLMLSRTSSEHYSMPRSFSSSIDV